MHPIIGELIYISDCTHAYAIECMPYHITERTSHIRKTKISSFANQKITVYIMVWISKLILNLP